MDEAKTVLITGATGFVGANLTRKLINLKYNVHILKRANSNIWRIKDIISKIHVHEVDLLKKDALLKTVKKVNPTGIFHLANLGMYAGIDPSLKDSIEINTLGTANLIDSAAEVNYQYFINTGSSSEYGTKKNPMREEDLCEPTSNYALSKLMATLYAKNYAKRKKRPLITLRIFSPFGPFDHPSRLVVEAIRKMLKNEDIHIYNSASVRDYIYIEDVIEAYLHCTKIPINLAGEIFNIGSGKETNITDLLALLLKETHSKSKIHFQSPTKVKTQVWQADIQKAEKYLSWYPKKTKSQGIKETVSWFSKNSYLYD